MPELSLLLSGEATDFLGKVSIESAMIYITMLSTMLS